MSQSKYFIIDFDSTFTQIEAFDMLAEITFKNKENKDDLTAEIKKITETARFEIVRALVNIMFTKYPRPGRRDCDYVARKLVLKYPFLRDSMGNGYVSYY